jgi:SAM-dependent methyltransferase
MFFKRVTGIPNWNNLSVLDYGGNAGNLLRGGLDPRCYTCVDVDADALSVGRRHFPDAKWIEHDALNWCYNPTGKPCLKLPFEDNSFDIVCAYSVHTHCDPSSMLFDIGEFWRVLKPGGVIATTVYTTNDIDTVINKRINEYGNSVDTKDIAVDSYKILIDNDKVVDSWEKMCNHYVTFYNADWLLDNVPYPTHIHNVNGYQTAVVINKGL